MMRSQSFVAAASFRTSQCFIALALRSNIKNIAQGEKLRISKILEIFKGYLVRPALDVLNNL